MKHTLKLVPFVILIILVSFLTTGCNALSDMVTDKTTPTTTPGGIPTLPQTRTANLTKTAVTSFPTPQNGVFTATPGVGTGKCLKDGWNAEIKKWESTICTSWEKYKKQYGFSPNEGPDLVAAMIWVSSKAKETAVGSEFESVGLLQIMPSDTKVKYDKCGSKPCFADRPKSAELLNGAKNIDFGIGLIFEWMDPQRADGKPMDTAKMLAKWVNQAYATRVMSFYNDPASAK